MTQHFLSCSSLYFSTQPGVPPPPMHSSPSTALVPCAPTTLASPDEGIPELRPLSRDLSERARKLPIVMYKPGNGRSSGKTAPRIQFEPRMRHLPLQLLFLGPP